MYLKRLRELREDHDLSQADIAAVLHVSQRTYSRYENNERSIPIDALIKIANIYNVSLDYITERTNQR